jgi:hypothetical protein
MSSQTKISKQYIGDDQVGSSQIQLENNSSLRSKDSLDVNVDLMKLDSSNQLQILVQPFLPGDASSALQAIPKQQLDAVESALQGDIDDAQADATQALSDAAAAQSDATQALSDAAAAQSDATQALSDAAAAQADVDILEPKVSTLESEMDTAQSDILSLQTDKANKSLNNLDAVTAIPSSVTDLQSENISQVFASEFKINTKPQSTSVSGSIRVLSGNVQGAFVSGSSRLSSGFNESAAMASATTPASGLVQVVSGTVSGGTQGSTGQAQLLSGLISSSGVTGNTGAILARSGNNSGIGLTGQVSVESGFTLNATGGRSGAMFFGSGKSGAAVSGDVLIYTGAINNSFGFNNSTNTSATGKITLESGVSVSSGSTGEMILRSGSNSGTGNSGDVTIASGTVVSGSRGKISMSASIIEVNSQIDMQAQKIIDLLDPTSAQDAATKAYVDAQISSGTDFHKQAIILSSTDISNQYVDLSVQAVAQSCQIGVGERVMLWESLDYSISVVGSVTRVSFTGPSASAGAEALVEGQTLYVQCVIE